MSSNTILIEPASVGLKLINLDETERLVVVAQLESTFGRSRVHADINKEGVVISFIDHLSGNEMREQVYDALQSETSTTCRMPVDFAMYVS